MDVMSKKNYRFKDSPLGRIPEEWEVVRLGDMVVKSLGGDWGKENKENNQYIEAFVLRGTDLPKAQGGDFSNVQVRYLKENSFKNRKLIKGDILIELSGGSDDQPVGRIYIHLYDHVERVCFSNFVRKLVVDQNRVIPKYFYWYWLYLYNLGRTAIYERRTTGIRNFKYKDFLDNEKIPLPHLPEQRKIAEILETIDNAIEKTDAIIEKYKRIKQGLMQDLLTKGVVNEGEGESERWRLRDENIDKFKDSPLGRIPEEWEVVDVYGHVNLINGGTPSTARPEFWNGSIPWLSVEDFNIGKRWVFSSSKYITELGLKQSATNLLKKGMLIISARGTVGVLAQLGADMAFNQSCYGLDAKDKMKLSNDFLYYALKHFITSFLSLAYGNVFNTITRETFKEILIPLPPLPEQQRIASILSQIDEVIEKEQAYKEKLERIKKGLMEDLLTGKLRVNHLIEEEDKDGN